MSRLHYVLYCLYFIFCYSYLFIIIYFVWPHLRKQSSNIGAAGSGRRTYKRGAAALGRRSPFLGSYHAAATSTNSTSKSLIHVLSRSRGYIKKIILSYQSWFDMFCFVPALRFDMFCLALLPFVLALRLHAALSFHFVSLCFGFRFLSSQRFARIWSKAVWSLDVYSQLVSSCFAS